MNFISGAFALLASMTTFLQAWVRFVQQYTVLYYTLCLAGGLAIRWFWCGQDIWRFINPMAPLFA